MRFIPVATVLLAASLAACNVGGATAQNDNAASAAWRPMPVDDAPEPSTVIAEAPDSAWRAVSPVIL